MRSPRKPLGGGRAWRYGQLREAKAEKDEAEQNLVAARRAVLVAADSRRVAVDAETHAREVDRMTQVGFLTG